MKFLEFLDVPKGSLRQVEKRLSAQRMSLGLSDIVQYKEFWIPLSFEIKIT